MEHKKITMLCRSNLTRRGIGVRKKLTMYIFLLDLILTLSTYHIKSQHGLQISESQMIRLCPTKFLTIAANLCVFVAL